MRSTWIAACLVAIVAFTGGALVGVATEEGESDAGGLPQFAVGAPALAADQYQGVCAVVTPPTPDPCDAANGTLRYGFFGSLVNSTYHPKWSQQNPGEVQRLAQIMAAPMCSQAPVGQPAIMRTHYGAALESVVQAIGCARHPEAIVMPARNPVLDPARADKQPPSTPGPLTVSPGP